MHKGYAMEHIFKNEADLNVMKRIGNIAMVRTTTCIHFAASKNTWIIGEVFLGKNTHILLNIEAYLI